MDDMTTPASPTPPAPSQSPWPLPTPMSAAAATTVALRNELRKIFWRKKYWALLVVYAAMGLGAGILGASGLSLRAIGLLSPTVARENVVYGALSAYRAVLLPLAIFMLAADMLTHELEDKTIKCLLSRPVSRFDAYLAKTLAILCYAAVALAVCFVATQAWQAAASALSGGSASARPEWQYTEWQGAEWQDAEWQDAEGGPSGAAGALQGQAGPGAAQPDSWLSSLARSASSFAQALAAYALTLVPMAVFVSFASLIAVLVRSPSLAMFLCIAAYGVLAVAGTFLGGVGSALFTTYTSWYRMWLGDRLPLRSLLSAAGLLSSTCVAMFGFGYLAFDRKDI